MAWIIVTLVALTSLVALTGFMLTNMDQTQLNQTRLANLDMRLAHTALVDAETGIRGYVLTGKPDYLEPYASGIHTIDTLPPELLAQVDAYGSTLAAAAGDATPVTHLLAQLRAVWSTAIAQMNAHQSANAATTLESMHGKALMDSWRAYVGGFMAMRDAKAAATEARIEVEQAWILRLNLLGGVMAIGALVFAFDQSIRDTVRRERAVRENQDARRQIETLFAMAEMLQSATDRDDANEVLRASATQLLPGLGGALYVFNNSRDRLDLATSWTADGGDAPPDSQADHITPTSCWALKRGKPHRNADGSGALRCAHAVPGVVSLEIPMSARGEVYGLLELHAKGEGAEARLVEIQQIAGALADAMSLALSSISLRERLRNQALRDPLTGLYNRRFMEEMLERLSQEAERRHAPLSVMMIDLDHFKLLNDQFGHATGDTVLRQTATVITTALRATDVACRYGGEELAILMPDCSLEAALAKAELIRLSISGMSKDGRLPHVSASFGIACTPETTVRAEDLLPAADAALYVAKQQGRDRVVAAALRCQPLKLALAE
jgi:diguanylate cyclase (GGDEF)-like protein